ncbi:MAG: hypothetical protein ACMXYG_00235 [Candidatus Woesearchaeota archaeon]
MLFSFSSLYSKKTPSDKSIVDLLTDQSRPVLIRSQGRSLAINYGPILKIIMPTILDGNEHYVIDYETNRLLHTSGSGLGAFAAEELVRKTHESGDICVYNWEGSVDDLLRKFNSYKKVDCTLVEPEF